MLNLFRPWLFWVAAPFVLLVGTFAGIRSVNAEQLAAIPTPITSNTGTAAPRQPAFVVTGEVMQVEQLRRTLVVRRADGKMVNVTLRPATIVKLGTVRVRPLQLQVGDTITAVGRPVVNQGLAALLITIKPRGTALSNQPSAVSGQPSAVSNQRSASRPLPAR
jgi:hypothetical protein